jgi:hypothetical protein
MQAILGRWIAEFLDLVERWLRKFSHFCVKFVFSLLVFSQNCSSYNEPIKMLLTMKNSIVPSVPCSRLAASLVAKFIVPDWGNKVDSGTVLSYQPATLHRLAGKCGNSMPESAVYPSVRDYEFGSVFLSVLLYLFPGTPRTS